jgi:hypothetical protein
MFLLLRDFIYLFKDNPAKEKVVIQYKVNFYMDSHLLNSEVYEFLFLEHKSGKRIVKINTDSDGFSHLVDMEKYIKLGIKKWKESEGIDPKYLKFEYYFPNSKIMFIEEETSTMNFDKLFKWKLI